MRLIDADALMREFAEFVRRSNNSDFADIPTWNDAVSLLGSAPTIEPKHGKWIYTEVREYPVGYNRAKCSFCNWSHCSRPGEKWVLTAENVARNFHYCPNCGAIMERSEE